MDELFAIDAQARDSDREDRYVTQVRGIIGIPL
jgi:hypothetical protein